VKNNIEQAASSCISIVAAQANGWWNLTFPGGCPPFAGNRPP